jgi:CBS domain-containing protein
MHNWCFSHHFFVADIVLDVYSKSDVVLLAQEKVYDINMTVRAALSKRPAVSVAPTCRRTDTLKTVMERLAATGVHRLICVDAGGHVEGIVSLHDIFAFIIADSPEQRAFDQEISLLAARLAEEAVSASPTRQRTASGAPPPGLRAVSPRSLAALRTPPAGAATAPAAVSPLARAGQVPHTMGRGISPLASPAESPLPSPRSP